MGYDESKIEGRNAVLEAFRSGKTIDKLYILDGCQDGPVRTIVREAKKHDTIVNFVPKERLDSLEAGGLLKGSHLLRHSGQDRILCVDLCSVRKNCLNSHSVTS